jgi:hypothetical protein
MDYPLVTNFDFPHGVRCAECERLLNVGQPYTTKIDSMVAEVPIEMICCVYC